IWRRATLIGGEDPYLLETVVTGSLGVASAMALALFAGRMDSQFISDWQWVIPLLFIYAGIQAYTGVMYKEGLMDKAVFTYAAFTLKCLLFIFVSNFFEGKKAVYYATEIIEVHKKRRI
ncbi:MAG: hypothetical protein WAU70_16215, partial [Flavobacteriales bacterium]